VAAGSEEMSASIREISETMSKSRQTATMATDRVAAADAQAQRLNDAAQAMGGIVELIGNITGQINLLALNATIESARAGEAGRGFAVVASEVKNLANQAKGATDTISKEIEASTASPSASEKHWPPSRPRSPPSTSSSPPPPPPWRNRAS
jgi:methyl-accepting chemotaxis protein